VRALCVVPDGYQETASAKRRKYLRATKKGTKHERQADFLVTVIDEDNRV
jgi:hypothetical protein